MFSRAELADAFSVLGVAAGDTVMVHASIRAVGAIAGGPDQIHLALKHVLTEDGTLVMYASCPELVDEVGRGNLTPDQERMWPSVDVALRNLTYKKNGHEAAQAVASIDPASAEVQNLKSAAMPLVMSFSGDQMRELQSISRVAGLYKLVPNF